MPEFDLEFRGVTKDFGDERAVNDVSFQVGRGEFLTLLGPSGCGKTTSLRMIAGFEQPTAGEIYLAGRPVGNTPPYRRNVNTVFQHYALFPHKNVFDNVAFGLRMKRTAPSEIADRVERMLKLVELPGVGRRFPHQLSGGQQQRIALARALINEPTVLLLDEPLGALDLKVRRRMQQELKRIHREVGVTFIYVTHDQDEALTMSDRIAVMNHGVIEQLDRPATIYEKPSNSFVAKFIGMTNALAGILESSESGIAAVRTRDGELLRGEMTGSPAPASPVEITIRPEKIQLSPTRPDDSENCLAGRIADIVYQGATTEYRVDLPSGAEIRVSIQNLSEEWKAPLAAGDDTVYVHWATGAARVLEDSGASEAVDSLDDGAIPDSR